MVSYFETRSVVKDNKCQPIVTGVDPENLEMWGGGGGGQEIAARVQTVMYHFEG